MMETNNPLKEQYSEQEAAHLLGVSVDELRRLVRTYVVKDDASANPAVPIYHKADLVLLRVLAKLIRPAEVTHV